MTHPAIVQSALRNFSEKSALPFSQGESGVTTTLDVNYLIVSGDQTLVISAKLPRSMEQLEKGASTAQVPPVVKRQWRQGYVTISGLEAYGCEIPTKNHAAYWTSYERDFCAPVADHQQGNMSSISDLTTLVAGANTNFTANCRFFLRSETIWLQQAYQLSSQKQPSKALRIIYNAIDDLLEQGNFLGLNHALTSVDIARLLPEVMVGMVRVTFSSRKVLPAWSELLRKIRAELNSRNIPDVDLVLIGLNQ